MWGQTFEESRNRSKEIVALMAEGTANTIFAHSPMWGRSSTKGSKILNTWIIKNQDFCILSSFLLGFSFFTTLKLCFLPPSFVIGAVVWVAVRSWELPSSSVPATVSEAENTRHTHHCGWAQCPTQAAIHKITDQSGKRCWRNVQPIQSYGTWTPPTFRINTLLQCKSSQT